MNKQVVLFPEDMQKASVNDLLKYAKNKYDEHQATIEKDLQDEKAKDEKRKSVFIQMVRGLLPDALRNFVTFGYWHTPNYSGYEHFDSHNAVAYLEIPLYAEIGMTFYFKYQEDNPTESVLSVYPYHGIGPFGVANYIVGFNEFSDNGKSPYYLQSRFENWFDDLSMALEMARRSEQQKEVIRRELVERNTNWTEQKDQSDDVLEVTAEDELLSAIKSLVRDAVRDEISQD